MKLLRVLFGVGYSVIAFAFAVTGAALVGFALLELWHGIDPSQALPLNARFTAVLESLGLLTIAVAALELSQTIIEEEIRREAQMSAPTRARRFLSRFLVVIVVSLAIEFLVAVFKFVHDDPGQLLPAAAIGVATSLLLVAWGLFVWLNKSAEQLEPEAKGLAPPPSSSNGIPAR